MISTPLHIRQIQSIRFILVFFGLAPVAGMNNMKKTLMSRKGGVGELLEWGLITKNRLPNRGLIREGLIKSRNGGS